MLQFLWILADHAVKTQQHPEPDYLWDEYPTSGPSATSISEDYRRQRGRKFHENRLRMLTHIYEAVTERIFGTTFALSNSQQYRQWLRQTRHNWQPMIPEYDLSTQSTESAPSSQAETLSMEVDSPRASPVGQGCDHNIQSGASQHTIPLQSDQNILSQPMDLSNGEVSISNSTTPTSGQKVSDIVNYHDVINSEERRHRRRSLSPSSYLEPVETTRPAQRRRFLSPTLSYIHAHTLATPTHSDQTSNPTSLVLSHPP
jgi:hypothetical protein